MSCPFEGTVFMIADVWTIVVHRREYDPECLFLFVPKTEDRGPCKYRANIERNGYWTNTRQPRAVSAVGDDSIRSECGKARLNEWNTNTRLGDGNSLG